MSRIDFEVIMGHFRSSVVQDAFKKKARETHTPAGRPSEYFGSLVFGLNKLKKFNVGAPLDAAKADIVAREMKEWARPINLTPPVDMPSPAKTLLKRLWRQKKRR